jgi:GNAT superfamily N-acetyltransferase
MKFIKTNILNDTQKTQIIELWNNEYPKKLRHESFESFESYLKNLKEQNHILLIDNENFVKGWYADFIRENEKWFAMILNSELQGKGFGTKLLNEAKRKEKELNGWVIDHNNDIKQNGEFYQSPIKFYEKNEFKIINRIRLELDMISAVKIKWRK